MEFVESAALALADELKHRQPEPQTASELIMAGFLAAFQEAAAEAYIDVQRPRSEIEQILRNRLEDLYRESEPWAVDGLSHEEVATKRDAYEKEIERSNAKASDSVPEARRKRITKMDFNELLTAQGSDTRMAIFEIARVISPELLAFTLNVSATDVHDHIPDGRSAASHSGGAEPGHRSYCCAPSVATRTHARVGTPLDVAHSSACLPGHIVSSHQGCTRQSRGSCHPFSRAERI